MKAWWWPALALALLLAACAGSALPSEAEVSASTGDHEHAFRLLRDAARARPDDRAVRAAQAREGELALGQLAGQAGAARAQGRVDIARELLGRLEAIDADDPRTAALRREMERDVRLERRLDEARAALATNRLEDADRAVRDVLAEAGALPAARALQQQITDRRTMLPMPNRMAAAFQKLVTLEFREAPLRNVFETLGRSSGVNFVFDKDVRSDMRINVYLKDVTLDDAVRIILSTQQLDRKLLNDSSVFIYPNIPGKQREHQELLTRSFFLANADVKQAQSLIKTMAKTRDVFIDERLNLVIIRDTPEVIRLVEGLIASIDLPEPEVMLEVEVMEIASNQIDQLGLSLPQQISYGIPGVVGDVPINRRGEFRASIANPAILATLHGTSGNNNLLANPKLRARNHEKARVQIGEKLPVFTTTSVANVGVSTSVTYLDTGLKLEVEPSVQLDNDVIMKVGLDVTNFISQVNGPQGSIAYQVGTRNATTSLRLHDGETQILAGLINDEDRKAVDGVPGLARMPLLGRLFGVHTDTRVKTEIVLLITPRVVRNLALPNASLLTLAAGNDASPGAESLRMRTSGAIAVPMSGTANTAPSAAMGVGAGAGSEVGPVLAVTTSGEVVSGSTLAVTLHNRSTAKLRGSVSFEGTDFQSTDGSSSNSLPFDLGPGDQRVVVLRALPVQARRNSDIAVDVSSATAANGGPVAASVEGNTTVAILPR